MKYITDEQLKGFFSDRSLMALAGKNNELDPALMEEINARAVSEIDSKLRGVYQLPLPEPVDPVITTICGDLMKYFLISMRDAKSMPEAIERLYERAIKKLIRFQNKEDILSIPPPTTGAVTEPGTIRYQTPSQKFGSHFTGFDGL